MLGVKSSFPLAALIGETVPISKSSSLITSGDIISSLFTKSTTVNNLNFEPENSSTLTGASVGFEVIFMLFNQFFSIQFTHFIVSPSITTFLSKSLAQFVNSEISDKLRIGV